MKCEICDRQAAKTPHHIITRGSVGNLRACIPANEIDLCLQHHAEAHTGRESFAIKYNLVERFEAAKNVVWGVTYVKGD